MRSTRRARTRDGPGVRKYGAEPKQMDSHFGVRAVRSRGERLGEVASLPTRDENTGRLGAENTERKQFYRFERIDKIDRDLKGRSK